jgi:hypothetical protein
LSNYEFVKLWVCQTMSLSNYEFVQLWVCQTMSLSNYEFVQLWVCPTMSLSNYEFVKQWVCQTMSLSNYEFVKLWVCQTMSLSNWEFVEIVIILNGGWSRSNYPNSKIYIENPFDGFTGQENDLSIAPMDWTSSQFCEPLYYPNFALKVDYKYEECWS